MGRKPSESESTRWGILILFLMGLISCSMVFIFMTSIMSLRPSAKVKMESLGSESEENSRMGQNDRDCCRGIEGVELWGSAVKWGTDFKFNTSAECCKACMAMCKGTDGPCLCDTWVFCGNEKACGENFGECWLKKQKDVLVPDKHDAGKKVKWTSGIVFGRGEGIVGLETDYGTLHIKLLPHCSPHSVAYILELLALHHCAGCHFYRAENRGQSWDVKGKHIQDASYGPPFALIQGTLEAQGTTFNKIQMELSPTVKRGSVAWVGSGPEFFISLANHEEWRNSYTVFGFVLPEDMVIAEKIAQLPVKPDVWNNVNVSVLEKTVPLRFQKIKIGNGELNVGDE